MPIRREGANPEGGSQSGGREPIRREGCQSGGRDESGRVV